MRVQLGLGLVNRLEGLPRELDLPTGLERDRAARPGQRDDLTAVDLRNPIGLVGEAVEDGADPGRAGVGERRHARPRISELLVLGTDLPVAAGALAARMMRDELGHVVDRNAIPGTSVTTHEPPSVHASASRTSNEAQAQRHAGPR
jgi:hypothetical protein